MAENLVTLTEGNFDTEVIKSSIPVVVDFWAEWCGPCKMIAPILDEIAGDYVGRIKLGKVNVDDSQQLAVKYNIQSIPTLLVFKGGDVAGQIKPVPRKPVLKADLDRLLA